jgi:hypothetical protein
MNDDAPLTRPVDELAAVIDAIFAGCAAVPLALDRLNLSSSLVPLKHETVLALAGRNTLRPKSSPLPETPAARGASTIKPFSLAHTQTCIRRLQAIAEYWGMLELNSGDNQGIRFTLASLLLEQRDHAGFERLRRFKAAVGAERP